MSQDKEREAFEAWAEKAGFYTGAEYREMGGQYITASTRHAWTAWQARAALATQPPAVQGEPQWREHVEQRIRTWRQSTMNKSGDRLAIDDFMGQDSIDDLVDFVCDEWASPPSREVEPRKFAGWLVSNSEGDDEFINNPTALAGRHYKGRSPLLLEIHETTSGIHSRGEGEKA